MKRIVSFWRNQGGNTAIIFGLAIIPLLALGGGAIDFAHRARIKGELQGATDTAALAAARMIQDGEMARSGDWDAMKAKAEEIANNLIAVALNNSGASGSPTISIDVSQDKVTITSSYNVATDFLGIIGINDLPAASLSVVNLPDPILVEISMVLDYSLSMLENDKYIRMRDAATTFIQKVGKDGAGRTKIGIVPFSQYVYATIPGTEIRDVDPSQLLTNVTTCLLNRGYPYSTSNSTPASLVPASQWPQVTDSSCNDYSAHHLLTRDLTDDFSGLTTAIGQMQPTGLTNLSLAAEMGWHMLSPNKPFETARDYSDKDLRKIMILLTDGKQTVPAEGPSGGNSINDANDTTAELCQNVKDIGVRVFTIAYDVDDTSVYSLLSGCASSATDYYEVHDASGIDDVFESIYAQIAEAAWLSK